GSGAGRVRVRRPHDGRRRRAQSSLRPPVRTLGRTQSRLLVVAPVSSFWFAGSGASRSKESSSWWATMEAIEVAASAKRIVIGAEDRRELERLVRARAAGPRGGGGGGGVAARAGGGGRGRGRGGGGGVGGAGWWGGTAGEWRRRFEAEGVAGLVDAPRPGRPLVPGPRTRAKLIALACTRPSPTAGGLRRERWTHRELAEAVGMSESQAHEIL